MAKGSEQFAWKLYPESPRICAACGKELVRDDVARVSTTTDYSSGRGVSTTVFYCTEHMHEGYGAAA